MNVRGYDLRAFFMSNPKRHLTKFFPSFELGRPNWYCFLSASGFLGPSSEVHLPSRIRLVGHRAAASVTELGIVAADSSFFVCVFACCCPQEDSFGFCDGVRTGDVMD